ncbi:unnamed protein product [[Candida] boidinii]|nr:unnamed protein product [[Candida] boidinii]
MRSSTAANSEDDPDDAPNILETFNILVWHTLPEPATAVCCVMTSTVVSRSESLSSERHRQQTVHSLQDFYGEVPVYLFPVLDATCGWKLSTNVEKMQLPDDIKHLFILWLEEEQKVAIRNQTKMALTYSRAIQSVKKYPQALKHPKELIQLKFIGEKVVATLSKKLEKYCDENGYDFPIEDEKDREVDEIVGNGVNDSDSNKDDNSTKAKKNKRATASSSDKPKKKRKYVPQKNSGGYAILLTLYIHDKNQQGMLKDAIIRKAGQFCEKSFVSNPSTNQFYSAWSSVKSLQTNDLVDTFGKPMRFALTVDGKNLARLLKKEYNKENNIESSPLVERFIDNNDNIGFLSPSKGSGQVMNSVLNSSLTIFKLSECHK